MAAGYAVSVPLDVLLAVLCAIFLASLVWQRKLGAFVTFGPTGVHEDPARWLLLRDERGSLRG